MGVESKEYSYRYIINQSVTGAEHCEVLMAKLVYWFIEVVGNDTKIKQKRAIFVIGLEYDNKKHLKNSLTNGPVYDVYK